MKNILFIVIPEKGHINPSIGVAQYLQEMGHEISFFASHDISEQLNQAGLDRFIGPKTKNSANQGAGFTRKVRDKVWLRYWIKELLIEQSHEALPIFEELITDFDLVVADPMIYPAVIACERQRKPWVALSNSLNPVLNHHISSELLDTVEWLSQSRDAIFEGCDLRFSGCDAISPYLTITFSTPEFTGREVAGIHQVGPAKSLKARGDEVDFAWDSLNSDLPVIYASFGSQVYHQQRYFEKLIEAVDGKEVQLVAAVHDLKFSHIPENVILTGYAPQLELLKRASVLVTHGGANSVMESLASHVPILINPICNDQFHQSWFIDHSEVGRVINLDTMSSNEVWEHMQWALFVDISKVSESYQVNGSLKAAQLIDGL